MAIGKRINLMQSVTIGAVVTVASIAASYINSLIKIADITPLFATVPAVSPITGTIGEKMIGIISGILPIGDILGFGIIATFISAFVIVLLGEFAIDTWKLPTFKGFAGINGRIGRLASVILWGSVIPYLLLVGFVAPGLMTAVGLAIYLLVVSALAVWIANLVKLKI